MQFCGIIHIHSKERLPSGQQKFGCPNKIEPVKRKIDVRLTFFFRTLKNHLRLPENNVDVYITVITVIFSFTGAVLLQLLFFSATLGDDVRSN